MTKICLTLTGKTIRRNLEALEKYRDYIDCAELRVDCLETAERFNVRSFPELAGVPVVLTIRRREDGGYWEGGEAARTALFARALAFAQMDKRCNFAYIDFEENIYIPSLEEAARAFDTRIIRSFHNLEGTNSDLAAKIRSMRRLGDEIIKAVVQPLSLLDVLKVWRTAQELRGVEKILISLGPLGVCTRVLSDRLGSALTFAAVKDMEGFFPPTPGQLDPKELVDLYHFRRLDDSTDILGVTGYPLPFTESPLLHNSAYNADNINAVYLPFPSPSLDDFMTFAEEVGLRGASVTVPYKESVLSYLSAASGGVKRTGACNTIVRTPDGWHGFNTDAAGFTGALFELIYGAELVPALDEAKLRYISVSKLLDKAKTRGLKKKKVTIIGAGGTARSIAAEISRLGAKALILNRTIAGARDLAKRCKFAFGGLDEAGANAAAKYNDIIIQATSLHTDDPFPFYQFSGGEMVFDVVYSKDAAELSPFLKRAKEAGCRVSGGRGMLVRQAIAQHQLFFGLDHAQD